MKVLFGKTKRGDEVKGMKETRHDIWNKYWPCYKFRIRQIKFVIYILAQKTTH
jgi:hypothetical protein